MKKLMSCIATPTPAEPAPRNKILCDVMGRPDAAEDSLAALMNPDRTTAPVPWIFGAIQYCGSLFQKRNSRTSSLKTGYLLRNFSR